MLGSFLTNSIKRVSRLSPQYTIPVHKFSEAVNLGSQSLQYPSKHNLYVKSVFLKDGNNYFDPKIEQLANYMVNFKQEEVERVYRNCDFEKDMLPALTLCKRFGFSNLDFRFIFKRKPSLLRLSPSEEVNDIAKISEYVQSKWNLNDRQVRTMIVRNPWIINFTNEQLQQKTDFLRTKLKMTTVIIF